MIYDRESKTVNEDSQYGGKYLKFLYNKAFGRILLKLIIGKIEMIFLHIFKILLLKKLMKEHY